MTLENHISPKVSQMPHLPTISYFGLLIPVKEMHSSEGEMQSSSYSWGKYD